jgi:hypothetical protein
VCARLNVDAGCREEPSPSDSGYIVSLRQVQNKTDCMDCTPLRLHQFDVAVEFSLKGGKAQRWLKCAGNRPLVLHNCLQLARQEGASAVK